MRPEGLEIADLEHLRRARDFMDRHYGQRLSVPELAERALMSPAHFSGRFHATYGDTPYSYLMTTTDQFWGVRDCAFRDPSGNHVRIAQA